MFEADANNENNSSPENAGKLRPMVLVPVVLLLALSLTTPAAQRVEEAVGLSWLFNLRGYRPAPEDVVIVAIHTQAAQALNLPLPTRWPRTVYAELIDKLNRAKAHSITLDIAFRNKTTNQHDTFLAKAVERAGNVILFRYLKRYQIATGAGTVDVEQAVGPPQNIAEAAAAIGSFTLPVDANKVHKTRLTYERGGATDFAQPMLTFLLAHQDAARELYVHLGGTSKADKPPDITEVSRFLYRVLSRHRNVHQELMAAKELRYHDSKSRVVKALARSQAGPSYINYYGPHKTLHTIGIDSVMTTSIDKLSAVVADKHVFVGYSDDSQTEQRDAHATVYSLHNGIDISGVEISATVFANLLDQSLISAPAMALRFGIAFAAAMLALLSGWFLRFWQSALLQTTVVGIYCIGSVIAFTMYALWLPLVAPLTALLLVDALVFYWQFRITRQRSRAIAHALEQYVPRDAAIELGGSLAGLETKHQVVQGVCMMSDIVGYSRLSESCQPHELHELMNRYYAVLINEVRAQGGVVANIVGDSLLAIWAGPALNAELCRRACTAALNISRQIDSLDEFCAQLPTCFAVHGGSFSLGNLGATGHFEYSPVGDIINTTARIEKYNRKLGTRHLASGVVMKHLATASASIAAQQLGAFALHNKKQALDVWQFGPHDNGATLNNPVYRKLFQQALGTLQHDDRHQACKLFAQLIQHFPEDGPSRYYHQLCVEAFRSHSNS